MAVKQHSNFLKIGAAVLLSAPVGFIFISIYNFNGRISAAEGEITTVKENIVETKDKINQIHWYLIEKNNVQVPQKVKDE